MGKIPIWLLTFALSVLWISSLPIVADALYGRLERVFPPLPLSDIPPAGCMVVLGGAVGLAAVPRVDIEFNEAIDRVYKAAQLYRVGKAQVVIVAAGNQPWSASGPSEAELTSKLLVEWGVPRSALRLDEQSRNTRENALNTKPLLEAESCSRPLLVTSAAHMPRAVATFAALGMNVFAVSTDVRVTRRTGYSPLDLLPDAHALAQTSDAMREWIGQMFYKRWGWI